MYSWQCCVSSYREDSDDYRVASECEKRWPTRDGGRSVLDDGLLILQISILVDIADGVHHKRGLSISRSLSPVRSVIQRSFWQKRRTMFLIVSLYGKWRKSSWIFRNTFACFWNAAPGTQLGTCRKMGSISTRYISEPVTSEILSRAISNRLICGSSVSLMSRPYASDMAIPPTVLAIIPFQVEVDRKLRDLLSCDRQKVFWVLQQLG